VLLAQVTTLYVDYSSYPHPGPGAPKDTKWLTSASMTAIAASMPHLEHIHGGRPGSLLGACYADLPGSFSALCTLTRLRCLDLTPYAEVPLLIP
jgi:hypothetical protein